MGQGGLTSLQSLCHCQCLNIVSCRTMSFYSFSGCIFSRKLDSRNLASLLLWAAVLTFCMVYWIIEWCTGSERSDSDSRVRWASIIAGGSRTINSREPTDCRKERTCKTLLNVYTADDGRAPIVFITQSQWSKVWDDGLVCVHSVVRCRPTKPIRRARPGTAPRAMPAAVASYRYYQVIMDVGRCLCACHKWAVPLYSMDMDPTSSHPSGL